MYFRILHDEQTGELSYLLADLDTKEAVLIDPRGRDLPLIHALLAEQQLRLRWALRTHNHDDLQPQEKQALATLDAQQIQGHPAPDCLRPEHGAIFPFGDEVMHAWHTPGHTAHCMSFSWRDRYFCGGLLAIADCPHQPFASAPGALWDSTTAHIFKLPNETLLFSGHSQQTQVVSTVMDQRRWNPFFARCSRDEFLSRMAQLAHRADTTLIEANY